MSVKENVIRYWSETELELKKIAWPTREEVIGSTVATIVISALVATFVWVVDMGVSKAVVAMFKALS